MTDQMLQVHLAVIAAQRAEADKLRGARQRLFEELVLKTTPKTIGSIAWLTWFKLWTKRVQDVDSRIGAAGQ